jgi:hypothetical protein
MPEILDKAFKRRVVKAISRFGKRHNRILRRDRHLCHSLASFGDGVTQREIIADNLSKAGWS